MSFAPAKKSKYPEKSLNGRYEYDLLVIGGGSGGLAASKEAAHAQPGLKVGVFDFVKPSPAGTKWGLGGTCVNVGCIPKKLMHYCGMMGHSFHHAIAMGWQLPEEKQHTWKTLVRNVDDYIKGLNFNYKKALLDARVEYLNAYASFIDEHTVSYTDEKGVTKTTTADKFIIAVGGRPKYPDIPGAKEFGITSDDIFWWPHTPGKTLCVGASYISLECAGFLHELGYDVSVMVRSILLRGFDEQAAQQIGEVMERNGVRFLSPYIPTKLERADPKGPITVTYQNVNDASDVKTEEFQTVIFAVGRDALIQELGIDKLGLKVEGGKIVVDNQECTNVPHIHAIGDVIKDRPELTPVAIQAGQLLARRLYANSKALMDYVNVPTTVFTPVEYGCVGLSTEAAQKAFGKENVLCYASRFGVLEGASVYDENLPKPRSFVFLRDNLYARNHALAHGQPWDEFEPDSYEEEEFHRKYLKQPCLAKLVVNKADNKVVGFHYVGPNAGEITQGFALAVKVGSRKEDWDNLVGIHPTAAEEFTTLTLTLESGEDFMKKGGC